MDASVPSMTQLLKMNMSTSCNNSVMDVSQLGKSLSVHGGSCMAASPTKRADGTCIAASPTKTMQFARRPKRQASGGTQSDASLTASELHTSLQVPEKN